MSQINADSHRYIYAISFLARNIKPHRWYYYGASALALILVGVGLMQTRATQWLVDSASAGSSGGSIFTALAVLLALILGRFALSYLSGIWTAQLSARVGMSIKRNTAGLLLNAEYGSIAKLRAGDTLQTVNADTTSVCDFLGGELINLFSQFTLAIGALIYIFSVNPTLALVTFAYTPIGMFSTLYINSSMNALHLVRSDAAGHALSVVEQALSSIPIVKSFMAERAMHERIMSAYTEVCNTEYKITFWNALIQTACSATSMVPRICYFIFAGYQVVNSAMTVGELISLFDLLNYVIGPSVYFPFLMNGLNKSMAAITRIARLEQLPQCKLQAARISNAPPKLKLDNVTFSYGSSKPVIDSLSFEYCGHGIIAVCGQSGSGKTTLLDLLAGLYEPSSGTIEISTDVAVVSQDSYLFANTFLNNVRIARPDAPNAAISSALKQSGCEFAYALPEGLSTLLGDGNADLSGGQRQRISLARAILSDARIWLLDEPTSALDADTEQIIMQALRAAAQERLIIMSAHRASMIELAERRIEL